MGDTGVSGPMTDKHTPEPWRYEVHPSRWADGTVDIYTLDGKPVALGDDSGGACEEEDARRIVACVNACKGITTERLENMWSLLRVLVDMYDDNASQADTICKLLKEMDG